MTTLPTWSSPFSSWHNRALLTPHPNPHTFTPSQDTLLLAVLLNAQVEHEGISLTLYTDTTDHESGPKTVAIDSLGRVLTVSEKDATGILALTKGALSLPSTDTFRNTWVIKRPTTSQPIDRLFIASAPGTDLHQICVQGYSKLTKELKRPIQENEELPEVLWELVGLVLEARQDAGSEELRDDVVLDKVRDVVKKLF